MFVNSTFNLQEKQRIINSQGLKVLCRAHIACLWFMSVVVHCHWSYHAAAPIRVMAFIAQLSVKNKITYQEYSMLKGCSYLLPGA